MLKTRYPISTTVKAAWAILRYQVGHFAYQDWSPNSDKQILAKTSRDSSSAWRFLVVETFMNISRVRSGIWEVGGDITAPVFKRQEIVESPEWHAADNHQLIVVWRACSQSLVTFFLFWSILICWTSIASQSFRSVLVQDLVLLTFQSSWLLIKL